MTENAEDSFMSFENLPDIVDGQICPFVSSTKSTIDSCLNLLNITPTDSIIDLGCGDGRIILTAIEKYNIEGVGIDINPSLIKDCEKSAKEKNLDLSKYIFKVDDFTREDFDFYNCTCICFYLIPRVLKLFKEKLFRYLREDHKRRCVALRYPFRNIIPTKVDEVMKIYYYDYRSQEGEYGLKELDSFNPAF